MVKITKRVVDAAEAREKDYVIWDDELPGFGLRVFASGKAELRHPVSGKRSLTSLHNWASRGLGARDCALGGESPIRSSRSGR